MAVSARPVGAAAPGDSCGPIRPHKTATSDESWDGPANEKRLPSPMSAETARNAYAWMEDDAVEDGQVRKTDCRFIHHEVSGEGRPGAANMTACSTGIGVLNGGRGGTTIPDGQGRVPGQDRPAPQRGVESAPS